tara:strand:- start:692 stop:1003 length:312 start_codon:yes stop_codon:yes gene_type:complete
MKKPTQSTDYIDVWANIKGTANRFSAMDVFILLATKGYGHSIRQISKVLEISPMDVKKSIKKLERAIRKDLKDRGANLKRLTNLAGVDTILEIEKDEETPTDV